MTFHLRDGKREGTYLLIGLAGASGSGKTYSAFRLAQGIAGEHPFGVIDTENGRALHYADNFKMRYGALEPPFRPDAYAQAIEATAKDLEDQGVPEDKRVIVVDSATHEHAGEGGLLDWHEEVLDRIAGKDWKARERATFAAWVEPKMAHTQFVNTLLRVKAHVILCFRAAEKIEIVKNQATGKMEVQPKKTATGLDGWVPIAEKNLPYEMTLSFLLLPEQPGIPKPIKLQEQHKAFVDLAAPIDEKAGEKLAKWAAGAKKAPPVSSPSSPEAEDAAAGGAESSDEPDFTEIQLLEEELESLAHKLGAKEAAIETMTKKADEYDAKKYVSWLKRQITTAKKNIAERAA